MKKLLLSSNKKITGFLLLLISLSGYSQVTFKNQGFESSAADNLTYNVSSTTNVRTSTTMSMSGASSLRFASNSNAVFENVNVVGYSNVQVSIAFAATAVDSGEDLFVEFSYDNGNNYATSVKLVDGNNDKNLAFGTGDSSSNPYTFNVPAGNNTVRVRVRAVGLDANEFYYIDNITYRGTEIPEINLLGNGNNILSGSTSISTTINTDFGAIPGTKTYTIENLGASTLTLYSASSSNSDYAVSFSSNTIAPGETATLTVVLTTTTTGIKNATISISNNDSNEGTYTFNVSANITQQEINIQSNGNDIGDGSSGYLTSNNTEFGATYLEIPISKTFTIQNTGGLNLTISSITITGTNPSMYSITSSPSLTVVPGDSTTFEVTFNAPTVGSNLNATINVFSNDSNEATYNFNVRTTTINPEINIEGNATSIANGDSTPSASDWTDFGEMDVTTGTVTRIFTIRNTGVSTLTIANPTITGTNAADFSITVNPTATTVTAGNTRTFTVVFNPSATGVRNAIINLVNNDYDENPYTFHIQGEGTSSEINIIGNNTNIPDNNTALATNDGTHFGNIDIALQTKSQTFVIENTGTTTLSISNPTISGTHAAEFEITTYPSTLSIAPGSSTSFVVTFDPIATGSRNATINIVNNDGNENPYNFNIRGTGVSIEIDIKGNAISIANGDNTPVLSDWTDFGSITYGTGNISRVFTIENLGSTAMAIANPTISGTNAADFSITVNPTGTTINNGTSRNFTVRFNPTSAGLKTAIITLPNNDFDESPYTFTVQGNATNVEINITGQGVTIVNGDTTPIPADNTDFGSALLPIGTSSRTFVIQNTGVTALTISNPVITGVNASEFTVTASPALTIPANGNTSFTVQFSTVNLGQRNATISITNDDLDENPYVFNIHGYGDIDTDGDGIPNNIDTDDDNDGITDIIECSTCLSDPFQNGSFETPVIAASSYAILPTTSVPGWQTSAENFIEIWSSGFNGVPSATGNQFAELNANIPGILYQTFCLNGSGGTINWSIKHRGRGGSDQAFVKFGPTLTGAISSSPIVTMVDGISAWGTYSGVYNIPLGQTQIVLTFQAGYTGSGSASVGNFIDDVQIIINQNCVDSDGDGIADIVDLDDDNDGIPDIEEAGFKIYSSKKSTMDMSSSTTWVDANGNGMNDYIDAMIANGTYVIPNTDGDSRRDYLDLDSDNDGIFDVDEAGLFNGDGDINGDGVGDLLDSDGDGILDLYDNHIGFGTIGRDYVQDTDGDGIEDFRELDSNNDGIFDIAGTLYANLDANNDGLIDGTADNDKDGIMDAFDTNTAKRGSPRDLNRKLYLDFDGRNDYAEDSQILAGLSNATLMAWIDLNPNFAAAGYVIGQDKFNIRIMSDRSIRVTVNGKTLDFATPLETARWYHVGAILGNNQLKLFLNGTVVATRTLEESIQPDTTKLTLGKNPAGLNTFFKGKIDEVRVFNIALTDQQFQRIIYQEIENNSSEVRGTIVPRNIGSLPFANLLRYYRMDIFKDDIIDNLTTPTVDVLTGMKMYNHKVINYQQAPMPFVTRTTGSFATAVHDASKDIRGLDVTEQDWSIIQVKHNITETSNNTDLGMFVDPGVIIKMNNDTKIQNEWYLKLDGKIDLTDKSQLVQTANSELDVTSSGHIERDQQGQTNKFNYNYWSSPVSSINSTTINHGYTVAGVMKDGTNPDDIKNILWTTGTNSSVSNPIKLSSYWIFKYQNASNNYYNWISVGQNGTLLAGQGYTLKGSSAASANQNYTFVGKPNNGTITATVGADNLLLTGNPYPSAIDADEFIRDNLASTTGVIQFWEHYSTNNTHTTAAYQGGYATRTLVGGTAPVAPESISGLGSSTKVPGRFIPVGQGFFIAGSATGGTLTFENDQRSFVKENSGISNTLFRSNPLTTANNVAITNQEDMIQEEEQFMKLKLGYTAGANNYYRQILIGFMNEYADSNINPGYDAVASEENSNDMYFINGTSKMNIQGEGYFNIDTVYPLGVKNATAGNVKFVIDHKENFPESQNIYIHDNLTNSYHNINQNPFTINLPAGTFTDRFSLRFTETNALDVDENNLESGILILHNNDNNIINIKNQLLETTAKSVALFNLLGQQITTWNVENQDQTNIELPISNVSTGTYIVKIITDNGNLSKKILIK